MRCNNCGREIADDSLFCSECGSKIFQANTCKNCGSILNEGAAFCQNCGTPVNAGMAQNFTPVPPANKKGKETIILIVALLLVSFAVSVLAGFFYLNNGADNKNEKPAETESVSKETKEPEDSDIPEAPKKPEKSEMPEETEEPEESEKPVNTHKTGEEKGEFPYRFNEYAIIEYPTYTRIYNDDYSYYCAVPDHFRILSDGIYYAPDNTALMTITADVNFEALSTEQVMYRYIAEIGGKVSYSATGDEWFALSMEKDGISYYRKCYVDHYIRAFSFSFPDEYLDIYDKYINYIEDNFRRTDV